MNNNDTLAQLVEKAAAIKTQMQTRIDDLRKMIADLARQIRHEEQAPVPLAEIDSRIPAFVAGRRAAWIEANGNGLILGRGDSRFVRGLGSPGYRGTIWPPEGLNNFLDVLCTARPDEATQLLRSLVAAVPFEAGTPSGERPASIERLKVQLAEREAEEERTVDEAVEAGLAVEHRPEVRRRRENEAAARAAEERAVAERRRRQAVLDEEHARSEGAPERDPATIMPPTRTTTLDADGAPVSARASASTYLKTGEIGGRDGVR